MNHTVTVIIPVLNAAPMLKKVLAALSRQTYPRDLTEIIVVDNGSSDNSPDIAESFGATVFFEREKKSPYAARNVGLQHASGTIIALTDSNKIPDKQWLEEGIRSLIEQNADLAGGQISFDLGEHSTSAEIYDAVTYNDNRSIVLKLDGSATGNLFFKREVFEKTVPFPDKFRSGMDVWWTQHAVQQGFKLVFTEKAIVHCQPRKLKAVLQKSWRVGILHPVIFRKQGRPLSYILWKTFRTFAPPKINILKQKVENLDMPVSFYKTCMVAWMCKCMMGFGRIRGLAHLNKTIGPT